VITLDDGVSGSTSDQIVTMTVSMSEETTGLELSDFNVTNGTAANLTEVVPGEEYTAEITAADYGDVTVEVPAGSVVDLADNENELASTTYAYVQPEALNNVTDAGIRLYPNPAAGVLNVELDNQATLTLINPAGSIILVKDHVKNTELNISNLSDGVYLLRIDTDNSSYVRKIIVKK
jgi:hypothetical protein